MQARSLKSNSIRFSVGPSKVKSVFFFECQNHKSSSSFLCLVMFFFGNRLKGDIPSYQLTRVERGLLKGQCGPSTQEHGQQNYIFSLLRDPRQIKCFFWFLNGNYVHHDCSHHHPPSYYDRLGNLRNVLTCPTARVLRQQMMKICH